MGIGQKLSVLDLFCGCGGLTLGAANAGFKTAVAVDKDEVLSSSFTANFPGSRLLVSDVFALDRAKLRKLLPLGVDGVVGGPPCQAFSSIGRGNMRDPRRKLVGEFFRVVNDVDPAFFLFENVGGLGFEKNIATLERGLDTLSSKWVVIGPVVLNAQNFGAPTRRKRLFVFGFHRDRMTPLSESVLAQGTKEQTTVRDAIADLSGAKRLPEDDEGFDQWKYSPKANVSAYALRLRSKSGYFSGNQRTKHIKSTLRRFAKIEAGGRDAVGKYQRLNWKGVCPTLRAGTGSDKGSYQSVRPLHPTANRVITVREAARLQGFPDDFRFHPTIWHSFRMIGNSVSPIIAEVLLSRIYAQLVSDRSLRVAAE